ncbi:MAG: phosphate-starvation-inducible PsiE family protein [Rhodospirillaceae bacterium]|jgi:uncharacterized membrane protein (DUF373 family)|nr:phosphate-starvation-inducible PsiE family protein [Rhodospirillaceae bacterium]MBT5943176.1 phosphate-starvation-inducible PsiE family protein [Rhodospirillaceae bacterium]MBT6405592.1 phosphate-starvation-inducible PsiE family protein [Rhodospirillaceae bacterium]MBT6534614.1 phosphate-starvation-inducible PsiE family protein [Rhodospirillaceae bacterium]MBT7360964.1 phosphate-starvation-inducible PsiE family protein [Rhodospirillaceae bacterium]
MKLPTLKDYWLDSNGYERFETIVTSVLIGLIGIVVIIAVAQVVATLFNVLFSGENIFAFGLFKLLFGQILLALIALEFGHSLILALKNRKIVFQIQGIVLIGVLAMIRKLILIEIDEANVMLLFGVSAILVGLAALHWAVSWNETDKAESTG